MTLKSANRSKRKRLASAICAQDENVLLKKLLDDMRVADLIMQINLIPPRSRWPIAVSAALNACDGIETEHGRVERLK